MCSRDVYVTINSFSTVYYQVLCRVFDTTYESAANRTLVVICMWWSALHVDSLVIMISTRNGDLHVNNHTETHIFNIQTFITWAASLIPFFQRHSVPHTSMICTKSEICILCTSGWPWEIEFERKLHIFEQNLRKCAVSVSHSWMKKIFFSFPIIVYINLTSKQGKIG